MIGLTLIFMKYTLFFFFVYTEIDAAGLYTALFELENSSFYPCDVEFQGMHRVLIG